MISVEQGADKGPLNLSPLTGGKSISLIKTPPNSDSSRSGEDCGVSFGVPDGMTDFTNSFPSRASLRPRMPCDSDYSSLESSGRRGSQFKLETPGKMLECSPYQG